MNTDKIIIKPEHTRKAEVIASYLKMSREATTVSIGGPPGVGKTEVAIEVARIVSGYKVFSLDGYYKIPEDNRNAERAKDVDNNVGVNEINWDALATDLLGVDKYIIEGIYANNIDAYLRVHLDATLDDTYPFRKERMKENPDDEFRQLVLEREYKEVMRLKDRAHMTIGFNFCGIN